MSHKKSHRRNKNKRIEERDERLLVERSYPDSGENFLGGSLEGAAAWVRYVGIWLS